MSDYIKREDAIKALEGWKISGEMILATVPSADVVEVVRCKDCNYAEDLKSGRCYCSNFSINVSKNGFCYCGEREEDE